MIAHVDMDSFYVSVERQEDPSLEGKPVAVGGTGRRGVVASASYEARNFGVKSAMPIAKALALCPELVVVEPHGSLYSERSREVFQILSELAPVVEAVSIDEAFLDLSGTEGIYGPPLAAVDKIRREVLKRTGLSCSIGLARVRHVAKMASRMAKPAGILLIPEGSEEILLAPLPVRKLPGIGPAAELKLFGKGLYTLGDLAKTSPKTLQRDFGKISESLVLRARGEGDEKLSPVDEVKSIGKEITFDHDTRDIQRLESVLLDLSEKVASRLRSQELSARVVTLRLRASDFSTWTRRLTLSSATQNEADLFEAARKLLREEMKKPGLPFRLLGVTASELTPAAGAASQGDLFSARPKRQASLGKALDKIREKYGFDSLRRGDALTVSEQGGGEAVTGKGALRSSLPAGFKGALREGKKP
ncbi:MAG: DNA polymerase IV [Bdellovibrionota bacterium]